MSTRPSTGWPQPSLTISESRFILYCWTIFRCSTAFSCATFAPSSRFFFAPGGAEHTRVRQQRARIHHHVTLTDTTDQQTFWRSSCTEGKNGSRPSPEQFAARLFGSATVSPAALAAAVLRSPSSCSVTTSGRAVAVAAQANVRACAYLKASTLLMTLKALSSRRGGGSSVP